MLTHKEKQLLKSLQDSGVKFMIVGLSAAVLQEAPVVTKDVDLWFGKLDEKKLTDCCQKLGAIFIPTNLQFQMPARFGSEELENLDIVMGVNGIGSFEEEYPQALDVKLDDDLTVKVLPLEKIIASKESIGRQKDLMVLPALKSTLATKQPK